MQRDNIINRPINYLLSHAVIHNTRWIHSDRLSQMNGIKGNWQLLHQIYCTADKLIRNIYNILHCQWWCTRSKL